MSSPSEPLVDSNGPPVALQLRLLGAPCLVLGDRGDRLDRLDRQMGLSAKDAALLCLVALAGPVRADRVAAWLWPTARAPQADTNLRQRLYRLRRGTGAPLLSSSAALLQLAPGVQTDLAATLQRIAQDPQAAADELLGDLAYDDLPDLADWLRGERQRWREQRDAALAAAAAQAENQGAVVRALAYAQRLAQAHPLAEHAQRRLLRLHYLRGDRASAIAVFESFEQRLKDELGTPPSAETRELMATIEREAGHLPARRAVTPASLLRPPRLVGRAAELQALQQAWGASRVFLLLGEAGLGKSRLLQEFAARQAGVLSVEARPGDAGLACALLSRLLRAVLALPGGAPPPPRAEHLALVLPELGAAVAVTGDAQRLLLQRAVEATLLDALGAGLAALFIDDLHFADSASLECLQALSMAPALAGLRWGLAQRPAEASAAVLAWRAALDEGQRLQPLSLQPLNLAQMHELVADLGLPELDPEVLAPALLQHTGGNPLFALETLKDLVLSPDSRLPGLPGRLPQPATVAGLVERRLAQLSAPALKLARLAALAGADFGVDLAAAVLDLHPLDIAQPWQELHSAQVLRDAAFAHDLIFEAARASVPGPIACWLHQRIAQHLQAGGAAPARVAPHWEAAQAWAAAGEAFVAAARQAQAGSQGSHEVAYWQRAAAAFEQAGAPERAFEARCDSVTALIVVHGVAHAQAVIDALLAVAHTPAQQVAALTARATAALMAADHATGVAAATQAGQLAAGFVSPWPGFEAARLQAVGLAQGGQAGQGLAVIEAYRARVESEGTPEQRGRFWADYAYVLNTARRLRDTDFALHQAIAHAQSRGDLAELATLTSNLATVKGNLGQVSEALVLARRSLALQAQVGDTEGPTGAVVETYVGLYCLMSGQYAEALQRLEGAVGRFQRDRQLLWTAVASNHLVQLWIELGQWARAQQALAYAAPPVEHVRARGATLAARIARGLGQTGQAELNQALALLGPGADPHVRMHALLESTQQWPARALVSADFSADFSADVSVDVSVDVAPAESADLAADLSVYDEVLQLARQLEFAGVVMKAQLLRAMALCQHGQVQAAATAMRALLAELPRTQPADMSLAQAWWLAAQVLQADGDAAQAGLALAAGAHWLRQVALPQVPEAFQDSFLQRNPINRELLAAADSGPLTAQPLRPGRQGPPPQAGGTWPVTAQ